MKKIIVLLTLVFGFSSVFATTDAVTAKSGHHNRLQSTVHKWYDSAKEKAKQRTTLPDVLIPSKPSSPMMPPLAVRIRPTTAAAMIESCARPRPRSGSSGKHAAFQKLATFHGGQILVQSKSARLSAWTRKIQEQCQSRFTYRSQMFGRNIH